MSKNMELSRFFGGLDFGLFDGGLLPILIIFLLFCIGDDLYEFLFCQPGALIWFVLVIILTFLVHDEYFC